MTSFSETWNSAFEAIPADTDNINGGAPDIRNLKRDIRERTAVDHSWAGDANDGKHNQATLRPQGGDPTLDTGDGCFYTKVVAGNTEVFYKDSTGTVIQLTNMGAIQAAGGVADISGQANFFLKRVGGNNIVAFGANTFVEFDETAMEFKFVINGTLVGHFP